MRTPINVAEIKQKIDYPSLAKEITTLSQEGALKRPNPIAELLNPVKDALLAACQNNVSIPSLARFLKQRGVPISDTSLRRYLRGQVRGTKPRRSSHSRARGASHVAAIPPPNVVPVNSKPSASAGARQEDNRDELLSPLAEHAHEKSREDSSIGIAKKGYNQSAHDLRHSDGPRIADINTI